jgi:recombinational DNA repair protein (RecF pathway)
VLAGFQPQWHSCVGDRDGDLCDVDLSPRPSDSRSYGLDPERGGALCLDCYAALRQEPGVRLISPSALSWLQALQRREYDDLKQFVLPDKTARELAHAMQVYIAHHLEYRPVSLRMVSGGGLTSGRDPSRDS